MRKPPFSDVDQLHMLAAEILNTMHLKLQAPCCVIEQGGLA